MNIDIADRLKQLPPYLFAKIDQMKREVESRGIKVLDFGVGDPDLPTPPFVVEALKEGLTKKDYHRYPSYSGCNELKYIIAKWFLERFSVHLNPLEEIIILIGSKEGIAHLPLALINPGEKVLYTSPGYPVYRSATLFAGGIPISVPLTIENHFLPKLSDIKANAKLFFFNYPNNPTTATASLAYFEELVHWAKKQNVILCHDAAYSELYLDDTPSPSIFEVPGAKDMAIEFHSLSKTFNMTGWRIGFAVGNKKLIEALGKLKTNVDSGQFNAIQYAAGVALEKGKETIQQQQKHFRHRRNILLDALKEARLEAYASHASIYVWVKTPPGYLSIDFCAHLLNELGVVTTPGVGFGAEGEGFFRFSLTVPETEILEAKERFKKLNFL